MAVTDTRARGAVLLDKDGTLLENVPYNVDPARMRLARGAARALAALDSVVLTPHVGGWSPEALERSVRQFLENAARHFAGRPVLTPI